ncbi:MAG: YidC/Oxa1 family membrane protein insertase, partial [Oscillospiraceae bacterium]
MNTVINFLSDILSWLMIGCYSLVKDYGFALILFTLLTKVILFPLSILIQKNSIKMVQMQPQLDALKIKYIDDKDKYVDEQLALYKKNHYHSFVGVIPLIIQLIFVMGLLGVVYNPLTYVLNIDKAETIALNTWLVEEIGITDAGNSAQLEIINLIQNGANAPVSAATLDAIRSFNMSFCGIDLGLVPTKALWSLQLLVPILAGLSALVMCVVQNKINVLQITAGKLNKYGMTIFMIAFSTYFAFIVPAGVGLYWIFGNLFAIPSMILTNVVLPPKKYIDIEYLKKVREQKLLKEERYKKYHEKERADYKRFCAVKNMELMFYSESNGFFKYYAGMIDYLCEHSDIEIHYVTSDPEDKIFSDARPQIKPYYVAQDKYLIPLFMKLDCKICVMTMPDLEKYHIKRSRVSSDVEYVYVSHGMGSNALTFRKGALDWYDTMFCVGIDSELEVRDMEKLYNTHTKTLIEAGYPLLDEMIADYESKKHKENNPKKILIAPSWQNDNIIDLCIDELLDNLRTGNY